MINLFEVEWSGYGLPNCPSFTKFTFMLYGENADIELTSKLIQAMMMALF